MRRLIRYLVANARVLGEAVLYHGSLRFLAMNPAVLVILWIRLSVTFGYPATLTGIRTISKIFGDTPEYKGISQTHSAGTAKPYGTTVRLHPAQYTSPFFTSYPSTLILRRIRESSTVPDTDEDTQIISIVRVSSTSMVKPKVIVNKSNEISVSVSAGSKSQNKSVDNFENLVTPFVSLLRNDRFDVDEDSPKRTYKLAARTTDVSYSSAKNLNSSFKPVIDYYDYSRVEPDKVDEGGDGSDVANATDSSTEQYVDVTERLVAKKSKHLEPIYEDSYDEQEYAESEHVYGETEKIYGQPEKVYDEPEKSYGQSEKVYNEPEKSYSEPEKIYGEPEKVYSEPEKVYSEPEKIYSEPEKVYSEPEKVYSEPEKVYSEPEKVYSEPEKVYGEPEKVYGEPAKIYSEPAKVYSEPAKVYSEPAKVYGEPAKVYGEPEKIYGEPAKIYGEPSKVYGEPEKIYGSPEKPYKTEIEEPETELQKHDNEFKMPESSETSKTYSSFTTKINDQKSSYIVDNGTYRKYRVEEKTPDGFIVGEYGMVSHQDGSLRGVRYTADSNINPSLIYETLVKFLSLK